MEDDFILIYELIENQLVRNARIIARWSRDFFAFIRSWV